MNSFSWQRGIQAEMASLSVSFVTALDTLGFLQFLPFLRQWRIQFLGCGLKGSSAHYASVLMYSLGRRLMLQPLTMDRRLCAMSMSVVFFQLRTVICRL